MGLEFEDVVNQFGEVGFETDYYNRLAMQKEKEISYSKRTLRIGKKKLSLSMLYPVPVKKYDLKMNIEKSWRALVLGRTGSGKSFLMRNIFNRAYLSGMAVVILTDVKHEYYTSNKPVQSNLKNHLKRVGKHLTEKPQGFPMKIYYPYYLYRENKLKNVNLTQINLNQISEEELITCFGDIKLTSQQKTALIKAYYNEIEKEYPSVKGLVEEIRKDEEIQSAVRKSLIPKVQNLQRQGIIGDEYPPVDIVKDIKEGRIPVLSLRGYGNYKAVTQFYVGYLVRKIMNAKSSGLIPRDKKLLLVLDELADFCPPKGDMASKIEIEEALRKSRQFRIYMLMGSQDLDRISQEVYTQINRVFLPPSKLVNREEMKKLLKEKIRTDISPYRVPEIAARLLKHNIARIYRGGSREWYYANLDKGTFFVFKPYAPLSYHLEE